ncbi:MAG: formylglycine-generating enzyme family protein [Planctomycetaceae bacterium]|nr:formylglycine-generating enzyme family protein [Planctomycetaceae bacterium]
MSESLRQQFAERVLCESGPAGDPAAALVAADYFLEHGLPRLAATAFDRAYGLNPTDESVARLRGNLLEELSVQEHGLHFRYVPAGTFVMGSEQGDPDERPTRAVRLPEFWVADVPMTWSAMTSLLGYSAPPEGWPLTADGDPDFSFEMNEKNKIRRQYCETETLQAGDHHAHAPDLVRAANGSQVTAEQLYGRVPREDPSRPFEYNVKPVVAVSWQEAEELAQALSTEQALYHLPTEAQWEKAARGGLIGHRYSWGSEPPDPDRCDCDHFGDWYIQNPLRLPANGYGLYGMCGGVWEWTQDDYDALAYREAPPEDHSGGIAHSESSTAAARRGLLSRMLSFVRRSHSPDDHTAERVLRGGSWADCSDMATVSCRMSRASAHWRSEQRCAAFTPTIGFRLFRTELPGP